MEIFKIWDKEFPLYNKETKNEQNEDINEILFLAMKQKSCSDSCDFCWRWIKIG